MPGCPRRAPWVPGSPRPPGRSVPRGGRRGPRRRPRHPPPPPGYRSVRGLPTAPRQRRHRPLPLTTTTSTRTINTGRAAGCGNNASGNNAAKAAANGDDPATTADNVTDTPPHPTPAAEDAPGRLGTARGLLTAADTILAAARVPEAGTAIADRTRQVGAAAGQAHRDGTAAGQAHRDTGTAGRQGRRPPAVTIEALPPPSGSPPHQSDGPTPHPELHRGTPLRHVLTPRKSGPGRPPRTASVGPRPRAWSGTSPLTPSPRRKLSRGANGFNSSKRRFLKPAGLFQNQRQRRRNSSHRPK